MMARVIYIHTKKN